MISEDKLVFIVNKNSSRSLTTGCGFPVMGKSVFDKNYRMREARFIYNGGCHYIISKSHKSPTITSSSEGNF